MTNVTRREPRRQKSVVKLARLRPLPETRERRLRVRYQSYIILSVLVNISTSGFCVIPPTLNTTLLAIGRRGRLSSGGRGRSPRKSMGSDGGGDDEDFQPSKKTGGKGKKAQRKLSISSDDDELFDVQEGKG